MCLCPDIQKSLYLRPENGWVELEVNEICAICDEEFTDEKELKGHVNNNHLKSTSPTKPRRNAQPPKRFESDLRSDFQIRETSKVAKKFSPKKPTANKSKYVESDSESEEESEEETDKEKKKRVNLELSLKKEGKMLREIGFRECGHRICMIKAPNVCGICGKKYPK